MKVTEMSAFRTTINSKLNPNIVILLLTTVFFLFLACFFAIKINLAFYQVAPFHYDSSSYLYLAYSAYQSLIENGLFDALYKTAHSRDSLDLMLRLIFVPGSLIKPFGHMMVVVPFMGLFFGLFLSYVFKRTASWISSIAALLTLFIFPLIYSHFWGIADYWKESIAVWLMGTAIIAWFFSENINNKIWSLVCGIFLGLLVLERTAQASYVAILFTPIFVYAVIKRIRNDGFKNGMFKILFLVIPPILLCLMFLIIQWDLIYNYYFVTGYAWGSIKQTWEILYVLFNFSHFKYPLILFALIYFSFLLLCKRSKKERYDVIASLWFITGFPLLLIFMGTIYEAFIPVWTIFMIIGIATVFPSFPKKNISYAFLVIILSFSIVQYFSSTASAAKYAIEQSHFKKLYNDITEFLIKESESKNALFLFDEVGVVYLDHLYFLNNSFADTKKIKFIGFMSVHDSFYPQGIKSSSDRKEFIKTNIAELEKQKGNTVISYCDPTSFFKSPAFIFDSVKLAKSLAAEQTEYFINSKKWKIEQKFNDSYYGLLCAFVYQGD